MMKQPITLILLGDIAAGKGTQAKILTKKFRLKLIDTGAFVRKVLTGRSRVSKRLVRTALGKLAPSDIIQYYLKSQISNLKSGQGILIDGGKMPAEASLVEKLLSRQGRRISVIYLTIPQAETFRRLRSRYYCEKTGEPLVIRGRAMHCPRCGGKIIKRADDDAKAVGNRIDYYRKVYSKTVKFWQGKKVLRKLSGKKEVAAVTRDIVNIIREYYGTD